MKRTHRHLEVVVGTQVDYILPEGKAACPQASTIVVPGLRRLMDLGPDNCIGVLFVNNYFTAEEYKKSDYVDEFPPHCLIPGLDDYEAPGVQNVFSSFLLSPRGVPVFRGYKKQRDMWGRDMWENHMRISSNRGSAQTAETLPQFMGGLEDHGVSNVTIWGADAEVEVAKAIDGFLVFGYKVCVMWDLCRSRTATNTNVLHTKFSAAIGAGQLEIVKYGDQLQAAKRKPL
jgi:nicotinamidase/pyrazinamidase